MKTFLLIFILVFTGKIIGYSQAVKNDGNQHRTEKFTMQWAQIDSLEKKGLPKSALEIIDKIYQSAKKENNYEQLIKIFIFKLKYTNTYEEGAFETKLSEIEKEIKASPAPGKNIMSS